MTRRSVDDIYPPCQRIGSNGERIVWRVVFFGAYFLAGALIAAVLKTIYSAVMS